MLTAHAERAWTTLGDATVMYLSSVSAVPGPRVLHVRLAPAARMVLTHTAVETVNTGRPRFVHEIFVLLLCF